MLALKYAPTWCSLSRQKATMVFLTGVTSSLGCSNTDYVSPAIIALPQLERSSNHIFWNIDIHDIELVGKEIMGICSFHCNSFIQVDPDGSGITYLCIPSLRLFHLGQGEWFIQECIGYIRMCVWKPDAFKQRSKTVPIHWMLQEFRDRF